MADLDINESGQESPDQPVGNRTDFATRRQKGRKDPDEYDIDQWIRQSDLADWLQRLERGADAALHKMHITEFSEKQEKQEEGISEEGAAGMSKDHIGPRKCGGD